LIAWLGGHVGPQQPGEPAAWLQLTDVTRGKDFSHRLKSRFVSAEVDPRMNSKLFVSIGQFCEYLPVLLKKAPHKKG
jgi:hypothetical protein